MNDYIPASGRSTFHWSQENIKNIGPHVKKHGSISNALRIMPRRYNEIMQALQNDLRGTFLQSEFNLMLNNALSTIYGPGEMGAVYADTYDEEKCVFEAFGVDREVILTKLKSLSIPHQYALVEMLETMRGDSPPEPDEN